MAAIAWFGARDDFAMRAIRLIASVPNSLYPTGLEQ